MLHSTGYPALSSPDIGYVWIWPDYPAENPAHWIWIFYTFFGAGALGFGRQRPHFYCTHLDDPNLLVEIAHHLPLHTDQGHVQKHLHSTNTGKTGTVLDKILKYGTYHRWIRYRWHPMTNRQVPWDLPRPSGRGERCPCVLSVSS